MMRVMASEAAIEDYISLYDMDSFLNDKLLSSLQLFQFPAFANVFIEQDEQHYLYFLVKGQVQCSHYLPNGKLAVTALSDPFAAVGDFEILDDEPVHSNVVTTQPSTLLAVTTEEVHRYGADDPLFLRFLIHELKRKLYNSNNLQINNVLPLVNRLSVYMLSRKTNEDDCIALPGKEELASLLGATPRHLNRVLKELVDTGVIGPQYPHVCILDRSALQQLSIAS